MGCDEMTKLVAILNVVAWAGFWSFGYLALTTPPEEGSRMVVALLLAAVGAALPRVSISVYADMIISLFGGFGQDPGMSPEVPSGIADHPVSRRVLPLEE